MSETSSNHYDHNTLNDFIQSKKDDQEKMDEIKRLVMEQIGEQFKLRSSLVDESQELENGAKS